MGWEKPHSDAGNFVEFALHGGDQFFFVLVKNGAPFFFRLEINEEFGVEETGVVRSVIGTAYLAGASRYFRKRAKYDSSLVGDADTFVRAGAGGKRAAYPERAFIQVRQKFRTDDAAEREVTANGRQKHAHADCDRTPVNRPTESIAVSVTHISHHWVTPFAGPLGEGETCQHGRNQNREQQCAQAARRPRSKPWDGIACLQRAAA